MVGLMATLLFGYDLNKAGQDYTKLIGDIKDAFPNYWHCLDSTWIVSTNLTPVQLRDWLWSRMDSNDEVFVVDITGKPAAWQGFTGECATWLQKTL